MARILSYPAVKQVGTNRWELLEDLEFHVGAEDSGEVIIVKKDFRCDFASIPRVFWSILPPYGRYTPASILHDALYKFQGDLPEGWYSGDKRIYSIKDCDKIFLEAMEVMDVHWWKRHTMYRAVRMFGMFAWK